MRQTKDFAGNKSPDRAIAQCPSMTALKRAARFDQSSAYHNAHVKQVLTGSAVMVDRGSSDHVRVIGTTQ